jgi:hypothetical protein
MIYKNSRYTKTNLFNNEGELTFRRRTRMNFSKTGSIPYRFKDGDRLYNLARDYYGDSQLWWVILDANPQYRAEIDIKYGDVLILPSPEEVIKCLM